MLNACGDKDWFLRIGAEVEVFLVIPDACSIYVVYDAVGIKGILAILAVYEFAVAAVKVYL